MNLNEADKSLIRGYHPVSGGSLSKQAQCIAYREDKHFVSRCLNVDVSSFGETIDEAIANLKEPVELYCEDAPEETQYQQIG